MGAEHKKALLVIFALLFFCLMAGSVFVAIQIQHLGIAAILLAVSAVLAVDIRWVLKAEDAFGK